MPPRRAVGIDLGTTSIAIARVDENGRSGMTRNPEGDLLIPATVFFEDEEIVFGRAARQAASAQPNRAAEWAKRDLGQEAYSRAIGGELLSAELVEGCLLEKVCADLKSQFGDQPAVVLSVPACFNQAQRLALLDAAQIAGVDLLGTINDTLAAALAFAESQGYLGQAAADKPGCRALLFDLGGGMLDVAIVDIKPRRVRILAVGGDARLGGRDWDVRLADRLADLFAKQCGEDPRFDMLSVRRLLAIAEETKHSLSSRQQARVHIDRKGQTAEVTITRQAFEQSTADLVERAKRLAESVLAQAGLVWRDLGQLLLVGGAARMPMIPKMLEDLSGMKPAPNLHPDEAIARGAALYAEYLWAVRQGTKAPVALELADLTAHSLGVEWVDPKSQQAENVVIIPRGTEVPCGTASRATTTADGQTSLIVQLIEGESRDLRECRRVARLLIRNLPEGLPRNTQIDVHYHYTSETRLQVKAQMPMGGQALPVDIHRERGLSAKQISDWKKLLAARPGLTAILSQLADHKKEAPLTAVAAMPPLPAAAGVQRPELPTPGAGLDPFDLEDLDQALAGRYKRPTVTPRKVAIMMIGYVTSALLGLLIGYYILMVIRPEYNYLRLRLPGVSREAPAGGAVPPGTR